MSSRRDRLGARPWRVFDSNGVVCIHDAYGREIVHWKGFDSSAVPPSQRAALARRIVAAVNGPADT